MSLSPKLLEILVCPKCKGDLEHRAPAPPPEHGAGEESLVCHACRLKYAVRDDIPIMLIDEATQLDARDARR